MTFIRSFDVQPGQFVQEGAIDIDRTDLNKNHEAVLDAGINAVSDMVDNPDDRPTEFGASVSISGWVTEYGTIGLTITVAPLPGVIPQN